MPAQRHETLPISSENDIVRVRQIVRAWSVELRFGLVDQTKLVTAASELARNTLIHGKGGQLVLELIEVDANKGIRMCFIDEGPGIEDLQLALKDGYTTGSGMGLGLPGAKRLVSQFEIDSAPGKGTKVVATKWKGR